ncbi:hypothetical protein ID866_4338 [Astraeus odoratus]|nr:hypothetical protein ID866_4338 [Astraeus odoratus]
MTVTHENAPFYDIIIIGGSVAGCATALSIFRSHPGVSILVLDDADPSNFKIGESLPAPAKRILAALCPLALTRISESSCSPAGVYTKCSGNASAWGSTELEESYAIMNPFGMGWHLDRAQFDEILRQSMCTTAQGTISLEKRTFVEIKRTDNDNQWLISAAEHASEHNQLYRSKWVVDASGRKATVGRKLGARIVKEDSLLAFYTVYIAPSTTKDTDDRTLIEACNSGWWYSSALPGNRRVVAYHTDDMHPTSRHARKLDGFINLLNDTTKHISRLIAEHEYDIYFDTNARFPICTAACSAHLEPCCQNAPSATRWCSVGDAAMAFDPLSSQGMITALQMGAFVGDVIAKDLTDTDSSEDPMTVIPQVYSRVWAKYLSQKAYFYGQERRFDGEFWKTRR